MKAFSVLHVREFMHHLFKRDTFNAFAVRGVEVHVFTYFEISGEKPRNSPERQYCTWGELRSYVLQIIKGDEKPRTMKVIFAHEKPETLHPNAAALFINILYENDSVLCTTATSQKNFEMDKQMDNQWDAWVTNFFNNNGIEMKEEDNGKG